MGCIKSKPDSDSRSAELPSQGNIKPKNLQNVLPKKLQKFKLSNEISLIVTKPSIKSIDTQKIIEENFHETKIQTKKQG